MALQDFEAKLEELAQQQQQEQPQQQDAQSQMQPQQGQRSEEQDSEGGAEGAEPDWEVRNPAVQSICWMRLASARPDTSAL